MEWWNVDLYHNHFFLHVCFRDPWTKGYPGPSGNTRACWGYGLPGRKRRCRTFWSQRYALNFGPKTIGWDHPLMLKSRRLSSILHIWPIFYRVVRSSREEQQCPTWVSLSDLTPLVQPWILSAKQGRNCYHFYILWYDLDRDQTHNLPI